MLQQTQVETVLPHYSRFLKRFPTIKKLANANEDAVLRLWSGLGYYNRARNLKLAAGQVISQHGGRLPRDYDKLIQLPGIGRYMAGAIMSIAFNEPFPIVDGNVRRVLSRLNGWSEPNDRNLWEAAGVVVANGEPRFVNQAMMELGATICTFRSPSCEVCPIKRHCAAYLTGMQIQIPATRKHPKTVRIVLYAVIDQNKNGFLMREDKGFWEFPLLNDPPDKTFHTLGTCRHSITNHRLEVKVFEGKMPSRKGHRRMKFEEVPVTSLTRKIYSLARRQA